MLRDDDNPHQNGTDKNQPRYPGRLPGQAEEDDTDAASPLSELCTAPAAEAQAICIKLESHGIACELGDAGTPETESAQAANWKVLVHADDLESARSALDRPDEPDDPDDRIEDEYYIDKWVCPKCHHPGLHLMPLSAGFRRVRNALLVMLALPLLLIVLEIVVSSRALWEPIENVIFPWIGTSWLFVVFAMVCVLCGASRNKRCLKCNWELFPDPAATPCDSTDSVASSDPEQAS